MNTGTPIPNLEHVKFYDTKNKKNYIGTSAFTQPIFT